MKCSIFALTALATLLAAQFALGQQPPGEEPNDRPPANDRSGRGDRGPGRPARKTIKSGVVKEFSKNPEGRDRWLAVGRWDRGEISPHCCQETDGSRFGQ